MRYLVFICPDESVQLPAEERATISERVEAWAAEMDARGVRIEGHVLAPAAEARTVRVRNGDLETGVGPVNEGAAAIAGFNIFECADIDEAVEVASKHPVATFGTLEIRAFAG